MDVEDRVKLRRKNIKAEKRAFQTQPGFNADSIVIYFDILYS